MRWSIFASIGEGNVGDELVLAGVIAELKQVDQQAEIFVFSHNPKETRKTHPGVKVRLMLPTGVRTFARGIFTRQFWRGMAALLRSRYVVIGGGGLFYDREVGRGVNPVLVWFLRCLWFRLLGRRIIIYGVGVGPVESVFSQFLLREICRMAELVIVRDQLSRRLLRDIGLEVETDVKLGEDPAWSACQKEVTIASKGRRGKASQGLLLGVSLRPWYPVGSEAEKLFLQAVAAFLDQLSDRQAVRLRLLPFATGNPDDRPFLGKLRELTKLREVETVADYRTPVEMIAQLKECDVVLAMRLHAMLLALRLGKPLLPIGYSNKTEALLQQVQLTDLMVPITLSSFTTELLQQQWEKMGRREFKPQVGAGTNVVLLKQFVDSDKAA